MNYLDVDQRACVDALGAAIETRATLVAKAGAGSGKTHTLACAISCYPGALAITHTRVACEAKQERIERICDTYDARVRTIHAIARGILVGSVEPSLDPESGVDFERMLTLAITWLRDPSFCLPNWLASRRYIVVDEFQDTGSVQNSLISSIRLRLGCALAVVGDFAQAIYGFQDATSEHMNNLRMRVDCREVTLHNNYRSHSLIVAHANRLSHAGSGGIRGAIEMRATRHHSTSARRATPLQMRVYRTDIDMVQAIAHWVVNRTKEGLLFAGDTLTLFPSKREARDYAHRKLDLSTIGSGPIPEDGTVVTLLGNVGDALPLGELPLSSSLVDGDGACNVVVRNPRRRILIACRKVAGARQVLNQVYSNLITKQHFSPAAIFISDRDNKPENNDDKKRMRTLPICLSTVHGAKGEEWDSVMHVDLGENLQRYTQHDDEEQRILYVSHTRAIDELWHVAACVPKWSSLTRYMTKDMSEHFCCEREGWEHDGPMAGQAVFFDPRLVVPPEMRTECLSVTEVSNVTRTVWEPTEERPPVQEIIWKHTPKLEKLPSHLYSLNAAHGLFLEWICLWHMHENATRRNILQFLRVILRKYSVNRAFANAMQRVFDEGTPQEMASVRREFDILRCVTPEMNPDMDARSEALLRALTLALERIDGIDAQDYRLLRRADVMSAMNNVRMQQFVRPDAAADACPVRQTIRHFDSHSGSDSWKLDDVPTLKPRVLASCRSVFQRLSNASVSDKFVCLLFMQSVNMLEINKKVELKPNEQAWRTLVTVLRDDRVFTGYIEHVNSQMAVLHQDALGLRENLKVTDYQVSTDMEIDVCHIETDESASFVIQGRADAACEDGVLEVTSRDSNYKNKVQQAHLYASILDKNLIYNYYIEDRLLVRRTRTEDANAFLRRSAEALVVHRGLPGSRQSVDRTSLFVEWSLNVRKRPRDI